MPKIEGREREYDDTPIQYPTPIQAPRRGPPYTVNNLPPPPRDGYEYILNPATGEFEERRRPGTRMETADSGPPGSGNTLTPGSGDGGGGGGGGDGGSTFGGGFSAGRFGGWPSYAQPDYLDPGQFDPGPAFNYREFTAPSGQSMLQEPGFQFRMDQGRKALESSAAGRGTLRSGGTLKDILGYGQSFASQEYGNVWNRALQEYDTNRSNAADIWGKQYGQRRDVYNTHAENTGSRNIFNQRSSEFGFQQRQRQAEIDFNDDYNRWVQEGNWINDPPD